jgi:acetyl-CoA acetyltransferase
MTWMKLGACVAALSLTGMSFAEARLSAACASSGEISAIQVSAVVQELTDAALSCGPEAMSDMQRFQTVFQKELRRSDATLKTMFKRLNGARAGDAAYDAYKTRAINHAEQRRIKPGEQENFCRTARVVFAAALAPDKPVLEDFVSGVPVDEANPVDSSEIKVAVALQGVQAGPDIAPLPRPDLPGDPPNPNLFPQ